MAPCRRCETDLLHCHGTLVRHADGEAECSDPGCQGRAAVHDFVIRCEDVQTGCCPEQVALAGTGPRAGARRSHRSRRPVGTRSA